MTPFSISNYLLIVASIFSNYWIGNLLRIQGFFTASLVGHAVSSLVVAILANSCVALVKHYALLSVILGSVFSFFILIRQKNSGSFRPFFIITLFFLVVLYFNEPRKIYFHENQNHELIFEGNYHYSGRASMATEFLKGDYFGRVRHANFYPHEWYVYHMFNQSTIALAQGLVPEPGLFTYLLVQGIFVAFILCSFMESWFLKFGLRSNHVFAALAWLSLGVTFFGPGLNRQFSGNAPFAVFGLVHCLSELYFNRPRHALIFALVFGGSAFRCIPPAAVLIMAIFFLYNSCQKFSDLRQFHRHLSLSEWVCGLVFIGYHLVSMVYEFPESVTFPEVKFRDELLSFLAGYRVIGHYLHPLLLARGSLRFSYQGVNGFFSKIEAGSLLSWGLLLVLVFFIGYLLRRFFLNRKNLRFPMILLGASMGLCTVSVFAGKNVFFLTLIATAYLVGGVLLSCALNHAVQSDLKKFVAVIFLFQLSFLLMQYSNLTHEFKNSLAELVWELPIFVLVGLFFLNEAKNLQRSAVICVCPVVFLLIFPFWLRGFAALPMNFPRQAYLMKVHMLFSPEYKRELFVGPDNVLKMEEGRLASRWHFLELFDTRETSECHRYRVLDIYSAILGAHALAEYPLKKCSSAATNMRSVKWSNESKHQ